MFMSVTNVALRLCISFLSILKYHHSRDYWNKLINCKEFEMSSFIKLYSRRAVTIYCDSQLGESTFIPPFIPVVKLIEQRATIIAQRL